MHASTIAPALVVVSALTLAGCTSSTESAGEQIAEELIESGTEGDVDIEIDDESMSMTDEEGGGFAAGAEAELPPAFPDDVPLFTYGTLIAAAVLPDDGFTATWRMESPDVGLVETYVTEWEDAGFTQGGFLDMSTDGTRVWTYQMTSPDLEVAVSATIADDDETADNLVSISGTSTD
jgi:predicted small secreted protein